MVVIIWYGIMILAKMKIEHFLPLAGTIFGGNKFFFFQWKRIGPSQLSFNRFLVRERAHDDGDYGIIRKQDGLLKGIGYVHAKVGQTRPTPTRLEVFC